MGFFNQLLLLLWKNFTLRKRHKLRLVAEIVFPLALFMILLIVRTTRPELRVKHHECHYDGKAMPSAGILPFMQSFMCTFNNTCHKTPTPDEMPGVAGSFQQTGLSEAVEALEQILQSDVDAEIITDTINDLALLAQVLGRINNGTATGNFTVGSVVVSPTNITDQLRQFNFTPDVTEWIIQSVLNRQLFVNGMNETSAIGILFSLIPPSFESMNATADYVQHQLCEERRLKELFSFPNETVANDVHNELCNLTSQQFEDLANVFVQDFDTTKFLAELGEFVNANTGGRLTLTIIEQLPLLRRIMNDSTVIRPFENLLASVRETQAQASALQANATSSTGLEVLGQFVCGRNSFLSIGADRAGGDNMRTPVDNTLNQGTTPNPASNVTTTQNPDLERLKDRACVRETPPRCKALFSSLERDGSDTRFLWRQIKPFIRGCILYYPQNPITDEIINNTQQFFRDLERLGQLSRDWENFEPQLFDFLNNSRSVNALRTIVGDTTACSFLTSYLSYRYSSAAINGTQVCGMLQQFLDNGPNATSYDWRNALNMTSDVFQLIGEYIECFNFDKFIGYTNNEQMMSDGIAMIENDLFWAALEFPGMDASTVAMPTKVEYKIRMDVDKVDSTKRIRDKYPRPGQRFRPWHLKYFMYGFAYIQDMLDHAIIRIQTAGGQSADMGIIAQQFPYPCYLEDKYPRPGMRDRPWPDLKYFLYGFAYIQDMLDHAIIKIQTEQGSEWQGMGIFTQQFPYPCYTEDKFIYAISRMLPLFMILAWILTTAMLCKSIVYEKERRLKEVMKIMGLSNGVHWMAWFINAFIMMFLTIVILVILLKAGKVLEYSDPSCVLFFMTIFAVVTIIQCFLISVFFSRPNLAACCAGFIFFLGYLPYMLLLQFDDVLTRSHKMAVGLSANVVFGYGCNFIALWEEQAEGLQWSNMNISPVYDDDFNMAHCILMMIVDTFIYGLFTWYIEAVFPGQYGIPKPFYFPFTKSYWCGTSNQSSSRTDHELSMNVMNPNDSDTMEAEPRDKTIGVAIRNMKKKYSSANKLAVDGLNINFYQDHITSFLGHNGAGKTTTMSILTGLFPPTEGTAFIDGKDIRFDMDEIRHKLGTCPQHNVLFDWLTVEEHLWFYARLKGAASSEVKVEIEQMIKDVGLPHKRHEHSSNLSGGMKRKLSVAIAFVGNSKTVILDEPTAGVDPYARRAIWQLLLKLKKGRTIILSTHHMDEADVLGDRIAIISQGQLCCVGSSLFLKNRYGNGYYLTLVRSDMNDVDEESLLNSDLMLNDNSRPMSAQSVRSVTNVMPTIANETEDEGFTEGRSDSDPPTPPGEEASFPGFSVKKVTSFLQKFIPEARLVEDNMTEMCYQMPDEAVQRGDFERMFSALEASHRDLGVSSFGISDTSLEEVFLKVAEENYDDSDELKRNKLDEMADGGRIPRGVSRLSFRSKKKLSLFGKRSNSVASSKTELMADEDTDSVITGPVSDYGESGFTHNEHERVTGMKLKLRQFAAIFLKRFHHVRRSKKGLLVEVVLPVLFILLAMTFSMLSPPFSEEPPLELHPWHYEPIRGDKHLYMFYSNDDPSLPQTQELESLLLTPPGVGNRCNNKYSIDDYPCKPNGDPGFSANIPFNRSIPCDCSSGWQVCPDGAEGPAPSKKELYTTDYLVNMTGKNVNEWLVKTQKEFYRRRYGGLSFGERDFEAFTGNITEVQAMLERILTAANNGTQVDITDEPFLYDLTEVISTLATRDNAKVWFNNNGWASSVAYMNVMNNLILRANLPQGKNPGDYSIVAINHPMKMTKEQLNDEALYKSFRDIVIAICVIFAMSFIPASFTMYLIEERISNSKHLQFVSGVKPVMYWVTNFCWDMINYLVPCLLCIFIFLAFNKEAYVSPVNGPCLVALLFLYGWAMIPLMYPFSRVFSVPSTALVVLKSVNIFLGTVSTLSTFILEFLEEDDEELANTNKILRQVFLVLPQYCLGRGLFDMAKNQLFADVYSNFGTYQLPSPFKWDVVGRNLFSMFMLGILFFIINLLIEYNFFIRWRVLKPKKKADDDDEEEDEDVVKERKRVLSGAAKDDVLRIEQLTKVFKARGGKGNLTAVDQLCVGVPKGQCFGLLGVNGAGKTTTFKMLTGDEKIDKGNAYVNNFSVLNEMVQVRSNIGYCPQFDALDPLLTGVEHLRFYARLRGIPEKQVKEVADWAIRRLGLLPHADKISSAYSGGNKRKLSTAISLIGNPSMIFLDEPTTGMDPGARRFLWDCISNIVKDGRSVILTSHSMEECEALCGRLAIMVNGKFRCIGSTQHLKNKFGDGYTVIIRVSGENPDLEPVVDFFTGNFTHAVLKERHHNMLQYQLGSDIKLSRLFGQIEAVRDRLKIEDYSVSQTTLDQVFINFAKLQTDLADEELDDADDLTILDSRISLRDDEARSVTGSTAGLIRHENRHSGRSLQRDGGAGDDDGSLYMTDMNRRPDSAQPVITGTSNSPGEAPIISLPYQMQKEQASIEYGDDQVSIASSQRRPRPIAKFDDSIIPNPEI